MGRMTRVTFFFGREQPVAPVDFPGWDPNSEPLVLMVFSSKEKVPKNDTHSTLIRRKAAYRASKAAIQSFTDECISK
jgi:hypothetical protein